MSEGEKKKRIKSKKVKIQKCCENNYIKKAMTQRWSVSEFT